MTDDNELRSRLGRLAETRDVPDLTFEAVKGRRDRRATRQRTLAVAAVFALVLGTVGVIQVLDGDDGDVDVASDVEEDVAADDEPASVEPSTTTIASAPAASGGTSAVFDSSFGYGGPEWIVPWGDGFLSFGQVFEPSDITMQDLVPDIEDRLSPEIIEVLNEAGITDVQESVELLTDVGLIDQATAEVTADPVLLDAYMQVSSGGTYRFEASTSPDGVNWTVLGDFTTPFGTDYFNNVRSDGEHLVIAQQTWDEETGSVDEIAVATTTDLVNWVTTPVPVEEPDVPDYVQAEVGLNGIALSADGWYLTVSSSGWVDIFELLPADVRSELESNGGYGWSVTEEGVVIESYPYDEDADFAASDVVAASEVPLATTTTTGGTPATTVPATIAPVGPADDNPPSEPPEPVAPPEPGEPPTPTVIRTLTWAELGITYDEYASYEGGVPGNANTQAWVGTWAGAISPATTPTASNCCQVVSTDAGFIAQSWGAYEPVDEPTGPELHFSTDGQSWSDLDAPIGDGWLGGVTAVDDGVLITVSNRDGTEQVWRGDASGRNWQEVVIPGLPATTNIWFNDVGSPGVATVLDLATYDAPPDQLVWSATLESDGFEIAMANHSDGSADIRVTELATGELVLERLGVWPDGADSDIIAYDEETLSFLDDEGAVVVSVATNDLFEATNAAMEAAREESGWVEPEYEYEPDFWFVASADGVSWYVEDLPDDPEGGYFGQAAVNGTTAVVRGESGWTAYDIG